MKLSIITPSFNQGDYLERNIQSVINQNSFFDEVEHIIIDGMSTDITHTIIKKFPHLKSIIEPDDGQVDAINKGLCVANGDIIGWLNSDDVYLKDAFKEVYEIFKNNSKLEVIYGQSYHIDANDVIINEYPTKSFNKKNIFSECYISQPAVFFRKSVFLKYGFLNKKYDWCLDYEYWLRLACKFNVKLKFIKKFLACTRIHPDTKTSLNQIKIHNQICQMQFDEFAHTDSRWIHILSDLKSKKYILFRRFLFYFFLLFYTFKFNSIHEAIRKLIKFLTHNILFHYMRVFKHYSFHYMRVFKHYSFHCMRVFKHYSFHCMRVFKHLIYSLLRHIGFRK